MTIAVLFVSACLLLGQPSPAPQVLQGEYLGQKPPGMTPEIFGPGVLGAGISKRDVAISPDGREIYFGASSGRVMTIFWMRLRDGRWSDPEVAPFATDTNFHHFEPCLSADGRKIYFLTNRPAQGKEAKPGWTDQNIWAADRDPNGRWGKPYDPGPFLNGGGQQFFPSLTRDGTLYFTRVDGQTKKPAIWRARFAGGKYAAAERLPDKINGNGVPYNAFIAPDESYLIACVGGRTVDGNPGKTNYFVFFRNEKDAWSDGLPFGPEINMTGSAAMSPYVSTDGKYFFFAARSDIYWIDAKVIGALKGKKPVMSGQTGAGNIHDAVSKGDIGKVEEILAKDPGQLNARDGTPLSIAVREGYEEIVKALNAAGASPGSLALAELRGEYLGQRKPAMTPALFAPGIVSTEKDELNSVFTPDGGEFYFTIRTAQGPWKIMVMKRTGEVWSDPRIASFSEKFSDVDLFISPDGKRLYFCSNRSLDGKGASLATYDIWVCERKGAEWSAPVNLGAPVNSDENEFYPSVTRDGTLYFQSWRSGSLGGTDIYRAKLENGVYRKPENLGPPICGDLREGEALVSPDESFVVLSVNRPDSFGQGDLYVSFRDGDGSWTEPRNLGGAINTKANENCPILSPDGKFLFYTSGGDIYWVSSEIIQSLRRK